MQAGVRGGINYWAGTSWRKSRRHSSWRHPNSCDLELEARTAACIQMLASLKKTAPKYCRKHLQQCLDRAMYNNNEKAIEAIKNIL